VCQIIHQRITMRVKIKFLDGSGSSDLSTTSQDIERLISMLEKAKKGELKEETLPARSDSGNRYGEISFRFFD
jgi:hypothetical protein